MLELLTLGGVLTGITLWGFWASAIILFAVFIGLTETEHWGWATTIFVTIFVSLGVFKIFNLWTFAINNPGRLLYDIGVYILIGCVWGAANWYFYCKKRRKKYDEEKNKFLARRNATEFTPELRIKWTDDCSVKMPDASSNKEMIMTWMYLWPFSIFGTFLSDFIFRLWETIYDWMGGIYDSISNAVWKGVEVDMATAEDHKLSTERSFENLSPEEQILKGGTRRSGRNSY